MPWGIQAKTVDDVVLLVEKVFTPLAGRYYRIEFLRDLIAAYLEAGGTVTCCPTFAHDLPMGWTTKAIREPARVLGPHQTWLYMHHAPLRQTAERYARTEEALATWEFNYRRWAYRGLPSETLLVLRAVACENMPIDWTDDLEKVRSALKVISVKNAPIRPNMV
jgi:hypothetical protein